MEIAAVTSLRNHGRIGGTVCAGFIFAGYVIVAADARIGTLSFEIQYPNNKPGLMKYAREDTKKVMLVGPVIITFSRNVADSVLMITLLQNKLNLLEKQGKGKPTAVHCINYLIMCTNKPSNKRLRLDFELIVTGYDGKVPLMYLIGPACSYQLGFESFANKKFFYVGAGGPHFNQFMKDNDWYRDDLPAQFAADRIYDGFRYCFTKEKKKCGGMVTMLAMTPKGCGIESFKYLLDEQVVERGIVVSDGYDLYDSEDEILEQWQTDDEGEAQKDG